MAAVARGPTKLDQQASPDRPRGARKEIGSEDESSPGRSMLVSAWKRADDSKDSRVVEPSWDGSDAASNFFVPSGVIGNIEPRGNEPSGRIDPSQQKRRGEAIQIRLEGQATRAVLRGTEQSHQ